jgi:hypothetical protein
MNGRRKGATRTARRGRRRSPVVDLALQGRWQEALDLLDRRPAAQQSTKRFGLLRAAVLQSAGWRRTLEKFLHGLAARFPDDAEVALEVAEFYLDEKKPAEARRWIRSARSGLRRWPLRNRVEVAESILTLEAAALASQGRVGMARRSLVAGLQRRPDSWALASALNDLWVEKRAR